MPYTHTCYQVVIIHTVSLLAIFVLVYFSFVHARLSPAQVGSGAPRILLAFGMSCYLYPFLHSHTNRWRGRGRGANDEYDDIHKEGPF